MLVGLIDGDGFIFVFIDDKGYFKINLVISLHIGDLPLLELIPKFFGVGNITRFGKNGIIYRVSSINDLQLIISHFDKYPLITKKYGDFLLFK